jgi:hypothetical protein
LLLVGFFFTGCGYHSTISSNNQPTISIPYIPGDTDGTLTAELVKKISSSGLFSYRTKNSNYILSVGIIQTQQEQIGYRRDRNKENQILKNISPVEGRLKIQANVSIIDDLTSKIVWGPRKFQAEVDFDYVNQESLNDLSFINQDGVRQTILSFSLGQVESVGSAQDTALQPLYRQLSQKIVDVISSEW